MTLASELETYLTVTGQSMRALSLRAGLSAKAVSNIINIPGYRPSQKMISALAAVTGLDLTSSAGFSRVTYADLIQQQEDAGNRRAANRLRWLCERAGWHAQIKVACQQEAKEFLISSLNAREGLTAGSFSTYKSEALDILRKMIPRQRSRDIRDLTGQNAALFYAAKSAEMPKWALGQLGPFLCFLADLDKVPSESDRETLLAYFAHRCSMTSSTEKKCRDHVREVAAHFRKLSADPAFAVFALPALSDPFENAADKFGVDDARLEPLLAEFDERVVPWAQGKLSRSGQTYAQFLADLDAEEAMSAAAIPGASSDKAARMLAKAARRTTASQEKPGRTLTDTQKSRMVGLGFLVEGTTWSDKTVAKRRAMVIAVAKVLCVLTDEVPESIDELTHPDLLELALDELRRMNKGEHGSSYTATVAKCMRKLARDYLGRPAVDLEKIDAVVKGHGTRKRGIAARNRAKLREFDDEKVQRLIDMADVVTRNINTQVSDRKKNRKARRGKAPLSPESARDLMATIAHCMLLDQAPRSVNVIACRLDWIAFANDTARIVVPAAQVKMRDESCDDLIVHLSAQTTQLLKQFLDHVRTHVLIKGDDENPYLFPSQDNDAERGRGQPYHGVLDRVVRLVRKYVRAEINPHLYRHLIGWIWLRESLDNLPKVQRLLGHTTIQTTIDYYAELDATLSVESWQDHIEARRTARKEAAWP